MLLLETMSDGARERKRVLRFGSFDHCFQRHNFREYREGRTAASLCYVSNHYLLYLPHIRPCTCAPCVGQSCCWPRAYARNLAHGTIS